MTRMSTFAILLTLATLGINPDAEAARLDRESLPVADQPYAYYLTTQAARSPEARKQLGDTLAFVAASLSRQPNLSYLPEQVTPTLYRVDVRTMGWEKLPKVLAEHYKYRPDLRARGLVPYWFRADWFCAEVPDPIQTKTAAHDLLYGKALKTGKEFRDFWKVSAAKGDEFGFIEGKSGVQAKNAQRLLVNRDTSKRTRFFESFDSFVVAGKSSPTENLPLGKLIYDGQELIVGMPKFRNGEFGALQDYFLNTGNSDPDKKKHDQHVADAPIRLVHDTEGLRGPEIRDRFDCIACHRKGMQDPTLDKYREIIVSGQKIYADKFTKEEIERLYQSGFLAELRKQDEDYAIAVRLCNGLTPEKNAANFIAVVKAYDADLDLTQVARELYSTSDEMRNAIADYSPTGKLTQAATALAHNRKITRDEFVQNVELLTYVLELWRKERK